MAYTSLHRSAGSPPGPVTSEMLVQAVDSGLGEAEDLDWKQDADDVKDNNREHAKDFADLEAPLRRTEAAKQLLLDLTHQFAVPELLQP